MRKTKYTKARLRKIELALLRSGSDREAMLRAGITKTTYYRWIKSNEEFREFRERTLQRYVELQIRRNPELEERAVNVLEKALESRELTTTREESEVLVDRETDQQLQVLKVRKTVKRQEVEPDLNAALKILGTGSLETTVFRIAVRKAMEEPEGDLYAILFGEHGAFQPSKKWGKDVVQDVLHLERLQELQEQTVQKYKDGVIPFDEYHQLVLDQARVFSQIKSQYEDRSAKAIGGKSYSEILGQVQRFITFIFSILKEITNDPGVKREDIAKELTRRVRERTGASAVRQAVAGNGRGD